MAALTNVPYKDSRNNQSTRFHTFVFESRSVPRCRIAFCFLLEVGTASEASLNLVQLREKKTQNFFVDLREFLIR